MVVSGRGRADGEGSGRGLVGSEDNVVKGGEDSGLEEGAVPRDAVGLGSGRIGWR